MLLLTGCNAIGMHWTQWLWIVQAAEQRRRPEPALATGRPPKLCASKQLNAFD